jgi:hypothetical protein
LKAQKKGGKTSGEEKERQRGIFNRENEEE